MEVLHGSHKGTEGIGVERLNDFTCVKSEGADGSVVIIQLGDQAYLRHCLSFIPTLSPAMARAEIHDVPAPSSDWFIFVEGVWTILADHGWTTLADHTWHIIPRMMTQVIHSSGAF
jgi:hypothetical protein